MELTPVQRLAAFVVVAVLLLGTGAYLFLPSASGAAGAATGHGTGASAPSRSATPASAIPSVTSTPAASATPPNIYQWLPFSQAGLAAAAADAVTFATDYGTYSYTQDANAYLAPMRSLITSQLAQLIGRAYAVPGLVASRVSQHQVVTGQALIVSLRSFGPTSLIFVVELTQRISGKAGPSQQVTSYAITLTGAGTSWQVSDIELASAGN